MAYVLGSFLLSCFCFYLFYWSLDVVGCLLFAMDIKGPQGCLAKSDCIYACSVSLPFSVFLISLVSIRCFGPSLNVILKDRVLTHFLLHPCPLIFMRKTLSCLYKIKRNRRLFENQSGINTIREKIGFLKFI